MFASLILFWKFLWRRDWKNPVKLLPIWFQWCAGLPTKHVAGNLNLILLRHVIHISATRVQAAVRFQTVAFLQHEFLAPVVCDNCRWTEDVHNRGRSPAEIVGWNWGPRASNYKLCGQPVGFKLANPELNAQVLAQNEFLNSHTNRAISVPSYICPRYLAARFGSFTLAMTSYV